MFVSLASQLPPITLDNPGGMSHLLAAYLAAIVYNTCM